MEKTEEQQLTGSEIKSELLEMHPQNQGQLLLSPKPNGGRKGLAILCIILSISLLSLAIFAGYSITNLQDKYNQSQIDITDSQTNYSSLNTSYSTLSDNYTDLEANHTQLVLNYSSLQNDYNNSLNQTNALDFSNGQISLNYSRISARYNSSVTNYTIDSLMNVSHYLADYYALIRRVVSPLGWFNPQLYNSDAINFTAEMAEHGLGRSVWPDFENYFYYNTSTMYGHPIHSYEMARSKLDAVYQTINITPTDNATIKIDKILTYVNKYVHYEPDINDTILAPMETLTYHSGDCEDYSILVGALFELAGIDSAIAMGSGFGEYHVYLLVKLSDLNPYGFKSYNNLTNLGLSSEKWIQVEPQYSINNQNVTTVQSFTLDAAVEIH